MTIRDIWQPVHKKVAGTPFDCNSCCPPARVAFPKKANLNFFGLSNLNVMCFWVIYVTWSQSSTPVLACHFAFHSDSLELPLKAIDTGSLPVSICWLVANFNPNNTNLVGQCSAWVVQSFVVVTVILVQIWQLKLLNLAFHQINLLALVNLAVLLPQEVLHWADFLALFEKLRLMQSQSLCNALPVIAVWG